MRRIHDILANRPTLHHGSENPTWLLGVCYEGAPENEAALNAEIADRFMKDFNSRLWITYRKEFVPLGENKLTSDAGWGCMLRSGQMMLAQALVCHYLGRQWRRNTRTEEYLKIVRSFGDCDSIDCPFSIQNLIAAGKPHGLSAGSWLGPYALCRSIEALSQSPTGQSVLPMTVYVVAGDAEGERGGAPVLCIADAEELCRRRLAATQSATCIGDDESDGTGRGTHDLKRIGSQGESAEEGYSLAEWGALLVLVPLVLGVDKVNLRYLPSLKALFSFSQSLGILGGKPGASTYLVGYQGDQVLYLDPHEVQSASDISTDETGTDTSSYHCSAVRRIPMEAIDPSLALGFYCRDRDDFMDLYRQLSILAEGSGGAPLVTVGKRASKPATPEEKSVLSEKGNDGEWTLV